MWEMSAVHCSKFIQDPMCQLLSEQIYSQQSLHKAWHQQQIVSRQTRRFITSNKHQCPNNTLLNNTTEHRLLNCHWANKPLLQVTGKSLCKRFYQRINFLTTHLVVIKRIPVEHAIKILSANTIFKDSGEG